ncbi:MAG: DUF58 domain-containing protein [Planctomycetota bacterium]
MGKRRYEFADDALLGRLERLHLIAKRLASRGAAGARRSGGIGDGLEFADHRAYTPGDDIRFIDWSYYARMDKLLLRMFHPHRDKDVVILLDTSASMAPGAAGRRDGQKFNAARRIAAALAYVAMGSLDRVICQPFADELASPLRCGRDRRRVLAVLDFLASLRAGGGTELLSCVERLTRARATGPVHRPAIVLLVSDLVDAVDELPDALGRLTGAGHDAAVLQVYAPGDADPPADGAVTVRDAETERRLDVDVTPELRESYRRRFAAFLTACEQTCRARGCAYAATASDFAFERFVLHTLRRAGVLGG